jgi:hypothetical protein
MPPDRRVASLQFRRRCFARLTSPIRGITCDFSPYMGGCHHPARSGRYPMVSSLSSNGRFRRYLAVECCVNEGPLPALLSHFARVFERRPWVQARTPLSRVSQIPPDWHPAAFDPNTRSGFGRPNDISYRGLKLPRISAALGRCHLRAGADLPQVGRSADHGSWWTWPFRRHRGLRFCYDRHR